MSGIKRVISDLVYIYHQVPLFALLHLRDNAHRLVRDVYQTPDGRGCLMFLLTESLPADRRIDSKQALTRYFGRKGSGPDYVLADDPFYQPAKWIVRLWDGQVCEGVRARYRDCTDVSDELVLEVLDQVIAERQAAGEALATPKSRKAGNAMQVSA